MTSSKEQALKAKILRIANDTGETAASIWQNLMLERFLARLAQSSFRDAFILKGGLLLSKYMPIGRQTQDLDFFAKNIKNEENLLRSAFEAITQQEIDDGFEFKNINVRPLIHPHMSYLGAQISLFGFFGKIRFKIEIDLGFGDIVQDIIQEIPLIKNCNVPLFEGSIHLRCYPKEFIFAEKLETIIYRGEKNSRMKDFHDIYSMIEKEDSLNKQRLKKAILAVFDHRKTVFDLSFFQSKEIKMLETHWTHYFRGLNSKTFKTLPSSFMDLINFLNIWITSNIYRT